MTQMGAHKLFDNVTIAASGTDTSASVYMGQATAMALHLQSIAGTAPDVTFTYQVSTNKDTDFVTPSSPVTIGNNLAAADVLDFAPEAAKFIRLIATNNNGANPVTLTGVLAIQED
jgi:hypothetical protein